jgi:hypothetical protein
MRVMVDQSRPEQAISIGSQPHRRIPEYEITSGDQIVYANYGVRGAIRLPVTFPVR